MRLLMIAHTNSEIPWTRHFASFFVDKGWTVEIISFGSDEVDRIRVHFVGADSFQTYANKHLFITKVPRIRSIIKQFKPDMIFAIYIASNGLSAALSWNGPLAVAAIGSDVLNHEGRKGIKRWLRELSIKYVCSKADLINSVSQDISETLQNLNVPKSKILQLPFGVNLDKFFPRHETPANDVIRLICTRRHEPIYNIKCIIGALAQLKADNVQFHCTFASAGSLLEQHKKQAEEEGLNDWITFTGIINHAELPTLLRKSDIYISASKTDGTSVSLLEAMAVGLTPVVSKIQANIPWIIDGETGLFFQYDSVNSIMNALKTAISDRDLRLQAAKLNPLRVKKDGDLNNNLVLLVKNFEQIVNNRKNHGSS